MKPVRAFARVSMQGELVAQSPEVLGMQHGTQRNVSFGGIAPFGVYCFKLTFNPVCLLATPITHEEHDHEIFLFTAAGNLKDQVLVKDHNGDDYFCPPGYEDAAVVCRGGGQMRLSASRGGFFVCFDGFEPSLEASSK